MLTGMTSIRMIRATTSGTKTCTISPTTTCKRRNISRRVRARDVLTACTTHPEKAKEIFRWRTTTICSAAPDRRPLQLREERASSPAALFLAYANSLLLYTVFSAICVRVFFASAGNKEVSAPEERSAKVSPA